MPVKKYRRFETNVPLPENLLTRFCVLARCSPAFVTQGVGIIASGVPEVATNGNLAAPTNRCGAPCIYGHYWCRADCPLIPSARPTIPPAA
jgi:hypothetical protein